MAVTSHYRRGDVSKLIFTQGCRDWEEGMRLVSGLTLYEQAKSYGCFTLDGAVSKECSSIWEGEEASGNEQRAKGNKSNVTFVVPENKIQCLEKQAKGQAASLWFFWQERERRNTNAAHGVNLKRMAHRKNALTVYPRLSSNVKHVIRPFINSFFFESVSSLWNKDG